MAVRDGIQWCGVPHCNVPMTQGRVMSGEIKEMFSASCAVWGCCAKRELLKCWEFDSRDTWW